MLTVIVFLPLLVAVVLAVVPRCSDAAARWIWVGAATVELVLVGVVWAVIAIRGRESWPSPNGRRGSRGWAAATTWAWTGSPCP